MSKTSKNLISVGFVLLILVIIYTCIFTFNLKPRLGLDLKGGISIVYEAKGAKVDEGVLDKTVEKIRDRVDKLGVAEPEISRQGDRNVTVQLPGIHDPERAKQIIGKTAQLQFRLVTDSKDAKDAKKDPAWKVTEGEQNLQPDKEIILPLKDGKSKMLLKLGPTLMTGDKLQKAQAGVSGETGSWQINFTLAGDGKKAFADITTANVNKQLAIVLDYVVESAPNIQSAITDGRGEITGKFTNKEANDLAIVLNTGALPVELKPITEQDVTATLGRDSLHKGLIAGIVGIAVVALFMLVYYRALGVITCLGLIVFGGLMYGFVCVLGEFWSLTLAGIAGVIVSIGIAADSSIVYFERLKEDIREGRTMRSSAERAYKSAFRTIIAADTVSFAAAAILYILAIGSVKGFAFTLGMATIFDVFISYFFTRPMTALLSQWRVFGSPAAIGVRSVTESGAGGEAG